MSLRWPRKEPVTFKFQGHDCVLQIAWCRDEEMLSMVVLDKETRAQLAVVSANLDGVRVRRDEIVINDDEERGLLQAMCDAQIVMPTGESYDFGYVRFEKCRLLVPLPLFIRDGALLERTVIPKRSRHEERGI